MTFNNSEMTNPKIPISPTTTTIRSRAGTTERRRRQRKSGSTPVSGPSGRKLVSSAGKRPGTPTTKNVPKSKDLDEQVENPKCQNVLEEDEEEVSVGRNVRVAKNSRNRGTDYDSFVDYDSLGERLKKTMYFANKLPTTTRPSFPLTMLAVNAFTSGSLGTAHLNTLEFLDLEMASEIGRNACVSPTALIMALVYLDRLSNHNPDYLTTIKPSELFVVALLVASKFIQDDGEDNCIYNDEWASSAKLETKQINRLELKFLDALDWRVNVSSEEFNNVLQRIELNLAVDQGNSRGWFTYTELETMSQSLITWKLIWPTLYHYAVQVITAATLTYAAILTTLLTSTLMAPQMYSFISSTMMQNSNFFGLSNVVNAAHSTGNCLHLNGTTKQTSCEDHLSHTLTSTELLDIDVESLELELEQPRNGSDLKLPFISQHANDIYELRKKYFECNPNPNLQLHAVEFRKGMKELEWKRRAGAGTQSPLKMNLPTSFSIFKPNLILT